jgi:hypothetical protein
MRISTRLTIVAIALGLLAAGGARVAGAQQQPSASPADTGSVSQQKDSPAMAADTTGSMETGRVVPADTSTYTPPRSDSGMYAPPDSASYAPPRSDSGTYAPPTTKPPPPAGANTNPPPAGTTPVQPPNSSSQPPER